ncbi:MAG: hypothetical protein Q9208_007537 [Pyrenodesmia sp. 3 TL-2023]
MPPNHYASGRAHEGYASPRCRRAQDARQDPADTTTFSTGNIVGLENSTGLARQGSGEMAPALERTGESRAQKRQTPAVEERNILDSPDAPRMTRQSSRKFVSTMRSTSTRQERQPSSLKRVEPIRRLALGSAEDSSHPAARRSVRVPKTPASVSPESTTTSEAAAPEETQPPAPNKAITTPATAPAKEVTHSSQDYALYEEAEAAVNNSVDPIYNVIQRLALRAESDLNLRELMLLMAAGNTSSAQRVEFQVYMMETEAMEPPKVNLDEGKVAEGDSPALELDGSEDKENIPPASAHGCSNDVPRIERSSSQPRQPLGLLPIPSEEDHDNRSGSAQMKVCET